MNILLINANPVVSRLLVLCTRDASLLLDEVATIEEVQKSSYDIVFVDEASYGRDIAAYLTTLTSVRKVFISYRSDNMRGFDVTIKKPFLPSQITEVLSAVESDKENKNMHGEDDNASSMLPLLAEESEVLEKEKNTTAILDVDEIEKIKALLDMDDDLVLPEVPLSDEEIEVRKIEAIKEQLISEGLEIVDEDEIAEELSIGLDGSLYAVEKFDKSKKKKRKKRKSKKHKFTEETMSQIENAVKITMASMSKKQIKQLLKGKEIEVKIKLEDNN